MTDPPRPSEPQPPPRPGWVKVFAIVVAVVVVVVVVAALVSGGEHGPSRHLPGGDTGGHTPPVQHSP
ncbi:MAG: hypothetical protein ACRDI3_07225 [Actinomycetota bacterium]